jgi:hypothetical protein
MRIPDELAQSRRRTKDTRDTQDSSYQAPTSAVSSLFYMVVAPDEGVFPTTGGRGTVYNVQLISELPIARTEGSVATPTAIGEKFLAINLGDAAPVAGESIVRCDQVDGQLFFTYRGNGSAS